MPATKKKAKTTRSRKAKPRRTAARASSPLTLTKPESPTEKKKSSQLIITGHETTVAKMRADQKLLDSLTDSLQEQKTDLRAAVGKVRLREEKRGRFHKTVILPSADGEDAKVIFQNKFNKIDVKHEGALKKALNGHASKLINRRFELKVKPETTLKALKAALGDKFEALSSLIDVHEFLAISGEFMETRAQLRPNLTAEENAACDAITEQCQQPPQVRLK
jgi:hypothetical protein